MKIKIAVDSSSDITELTGVDFASVPLKIVTDEKEYVDIRNVISLREHLKQLKTRVLEEKDVALDGHKIACLLFEVSTLIKMLVAKFDKTKEDIIEYLLLTSEYLYTCGRIINIEILCFENIN